MTLHRHHFQDGKCTMPDCDLPKELAISYQAYHQGKEDGVREFAERVKSRIANAPDGHIIFAALKVANRIIDQELETLTARGKE